VRGIFLLCNRKKCLSPFYAQFQSFRLLVVSYNVKKMRIGKRKNPKNAAPQADAASPKPRQVRNDDITRLVRAKRMDRIRIIAGILAALVLVCAGLYFFLYQPYQEGMALIKRSEEQVKSGDLSGARKSISKARLVTPYLKSLYYREGLVQLLQMDYAGAESSFGKEISSNGYAGGSELALGFMYSIDSVLADSAIPVENKKVIIEELSRVLELDISLDSKSPALGLEEKGGFSVAADYFSRALDAGKQFTSLASFGLAYVNALRGERDAGSKSFALIASNRDRFPLLAKYYDGTESRLGTSTVPSEINPSSSEKNPETPASAKEPVGPDLPVGDLPPTPDNVQMPESPPDIGMPSTTKLPSMSHLKAFTRKPTVKPFKLKQYTGKDGRLKYIVTLLNISEAGKTVAREGQAREMPYTKVQVLVVKITENEIVLKEDNMYTFKWKRERENWVEEEPSEEDH